MGLAELCKKYIGPSMFILQTMERVDPQDFTEWVLCIATISVLIVVTGKLFPG
jgi:hypothetical protein